MKNIREGACPAVELKQVSFGYRNRKIFDAVNMVIEPGSTVGIVGLSGSGKTSLIRLINGALQREGRHGYEGEVLIKGQDTLKYDHLNRVIGTVYQDIDSQLIFNTAIDEIVFGMENYGYSKRVMTEKVDEMTETLGIEHLLYQNPNNMSGGEKQLVVLASLLCLEVEILILDEAMSGVDQGTREKVLSVLKTLKEKGVTIIMVEHDYSNLNNADVIYRIEGQKIEPWHL